MSITEKRKKKGQISDPKLSLRRRPACQTLSKPLHISSAKPGLALELLKVVAILSDITVRRSVVEIEKA